MNENFINFIESELAEVNDKIQILSDYVESIKKEYPDIRKASVKDLSKICTNYKINRYGFILRTDYEGMCLEHKEFSIDDGKLYLVDTYKLKDKYGYKFRGACLRGKYGDNYSINRFCSRNSCILSKGDKEFKKFLLDNNLEIKQNQCICRKYKDYYLLEDYCRYKKGKILEIFESYITVKGTKYSRSISQIKMSKNGDIELID